MFLEGTTDSIIINIIIYYDQITYVSAFFWPSSGVTKLSFSLTILLFKCTYDGQKMPKHVAQNVK
jgi:hypothetical protein